MPSSVSPHKEKEPSKAYHPLTLKAESEGLESEPKDLRTPVKSLSQGFYFNSHQYSHTPKTRPHIGLLSGACSPQLNTPISGSVSRTARLCRLSCSGDSSAKSTPKFTTPGGTSHHVVGNPFESPSQVSQLHDHVFSPNCFKNTAPDSAEKTPKTFRWSIDQVALLNPADIEEMPIQQDTLNIRKDKRTEARLQKTLDSYFSKQQVVPSPLSHPPPKHVLPRTPGYHDSPMVVDFLRETGKFKHEKKTQQDAGCQTMLSLPMSFDLQEVLGAEHYRQRAASADVADSSMKSEHSTSASDTSTLRRKLFFHGDEGTPLSPVRQQRHSMEERYLPHEPPSPNAAQFSSSPLRPSDVTPIRRCSTAPNLDTLASPFLSPITQEQSTETVPDTLGVDGPLCGIPSPLRASSGARQPCRRSLDMSPIHDGSYIDEASSRETDEKMLSLCSLTPPPSSPYPSSPVSPSSLSVSQSLFSKHRFADGPPDDRISLLSECDPATSQDTGYNTESGMHTNLTNQFGQLLDSAAAARTFAGVFPKGDDGDDNDNACFETALPISQSRQHRPNVISRQMSEPILPKQAMKLTSSLNSSDNEPSDLMRSMPEYLFGASIPISISRQPPVVSNEQQILNESSPPSFTAEHCRTPPAEVPLLQQSNDQLYERAHKVIEMYSPMEQGTPVARARNLPGGVQWYTQGADTPSRELISGMSQTLERWQYDVNKMRPSEMAREVLRKAGGDYQKVASGQKLDDDTCCFEDSGHMDMSFTT